MKKYLGIEFGSTRIKGVLIDENHHIIASGSFIWENQLINGIWTYSLELAKQGLRECYKKLKEDYQNKYHEKLTHIDCIGVSGMMHGYLVFDKDKKQIKEFRTWRNTITEQASKLLTKAFNFHVPQRWSIAHIYQAILNEEDGVKDISFATTLSGYFHYLLSGEKVLGINDASGMFPINTKTLDYDQEMIKTFNDLVKDKVSWNIIDLLPKVLIAGKEAGRLTESGRDLLDIDKELEVGVPLCPPEGDMGTGMVCTNSTKAHTGNASIGTSSNMTIVIDKDIGVYPEIDVIVTPTGSNAALVHVNNGTSEINAWEKLFKEVILNFNKDVTDEEIYSLMFNAALKDASIKGLYPVDYFSGEPISKVNEGKLLFIREPDAKLDLSSFMLSHIYSLLATIRLGVDVLRDKENIKLDKVIGHGGFFKTPKVGELTLSASLNVPVLTLKSAGEGGPYGEALLASYLMEKENDETLDEYLDKIFKTQESHEYMATQKEVDKFNEFLEKYIKALIIEKEVIKTFK